MRRCEKCYQSLHGTINLRRRIEILEEENFKLRERNECYRELLMRIGDIYTHQATKVLKESGWPIIPPEQRLVQS